MDFTKWKRWMSALVGMAVFAGFASPVVVGGANPQTEAQRQRLELRILEVTDAADPFSPAVQDGRKDRNTLRVVFAAGPLSVVPVPPQPEEDPLDLIYQYTTNRHVSVRLVYAISSPGGPEVRSFPRELEFSTPLDLVELPTLEGGAAPFARISTEIEWDGKDFSDAFVPDDVYAYLVSADLFTFTGALHGEGPVVVITPDGQRVLAHAPPASGETTVDNTAPEIAVTWPPAADFGTDLSQVEIEGRLTDNLAGVEEGTLRDHAGTVALPSPEFGLVRELETEVAEGEISRSNSFELRATDRAGNTTDATLRVRHTLAATMLPIDPSKTELSPAGVVTSTDRGLVFFQPSIDRATIHEVVRQEGGRVAGYLTVPNAALAIFETERLAELQEKLANLEQRSEVDLAVPSALGELLSAGGLILDNDSLPPLARLAYDRIRSRGAPRFIVDEGLPLGPASVAVIDTGLDTSFGRNDEFADVQFYDLCTPEGLEGQTGTPVDPHGHGTWVTGVIAGANNGDGNNGLIRGVPGSDFDVHVFRVTCVPAPSVELNLVLAAMSLITSAQGGAIGDIDVVNMSFGLPSEISEILEFYFDVLARGRQILWVAGAGNGGPDQIGDEMSCDDFQTLSFPAGLACSLDNVVSVGAVDPVDFTRNSFSNYGAITLSAPGSGVWTARSPGLYGGFDGTSAAAPLVSGAAALLLAVSPMSPQLVKARLEQTTQLLEDADLPEGGLDVVALLETVPVPLARHSRNGTGNYGAVVAVPTIQRPGLAGWSFNFRGDNTDWEITRIQALTFEDRLEVEYSGALPTNRLYDFKVDRQGLPPGTILRSVTGFVSGDEGETRLLSAAGETDGVPVLRGFNIFHGSEHNLERLKVQVRRLVNGQIDLEILFHDETPGNDSFSYQVDYAIVPPDRIRHRGQLAGAFVTGSDSRALGADHPVLQGFDLRFLNGDHELDVIGARVRPGAAEVWLNDRNDDDPFAWSLWWADVR